MGPPDPTDSRTTSQRWHDALGQLVRETLDRGDLPIGGGERPHVTVTVDVTTLQGKDGAPAAELVRYGAISGQAARRIACDAIATYALLAGPSQILDIGRASRIVPSGMRRALALRDKGCVAGGAPVSWCDAHHVIHWIDGGKTKLSNFILL